MFKYIIGNFVKTQLITDIGKETHIDAILRKIESNSHYVNDK